MNPWGTGAPPPSYGPSGTNIYGANSPIKAMAGDDQNKQRLIAEHLRRQYDANTFANGSPVNAGFAAKLQGMFDPNGISQQGYGAFQNYLDQLENLQAQREGQLKGMAQATAESMQPKSLVSSR